MFAVVFHVCSHQNQSGGTRYERPVPLSAVYVAGQVLYMGDLAGNVSFFNLANGETGSLNYQESTTVSHPPQLS